MAEADSLALRFMTAADVEQVAALDGSTFSTGWSAESYRRELANPTARYLVLTRDGAFVGFGGIWIIVDQAHVVTVTVEPAARGHGYGALLVHGLLTLATSFEVVDVTLEVRASNDVARGLYRAYGFLEVGRRERYYDNREDAIIMTTESVTSAGHGRVMARRRQRIDDRFPGVISAFEELVQVEMGGDEPG